MKLLIDTCALIWFLRNDPELSKKAAEVIETPKNEAYVSTVSIWEIVIKAQLGKLQAPQGLTTNLEAQLVRNGFQILDMQFAHAAMVYSLPFAHRDPFDRLLISQCREENLSAVTNDDSWKDPAYGINVLW